MTAMTPGSNLPLTAQRVAVEVTAPSRLDVSGLLLSANGKVRSDADFVFYNQPAGPGVTHSGGAADTVTVDTASVPADVEKVVVTASLDTAAAPGATFAGTEPTATVRDADTGAVLATFTPPRLGAETALVVTEVYRRGDAWKVRAVGQGYADGLAGIAKDFGVDIDEPAASAPAAPTAPAAPSGPPGPPAPGAPAGVPAPPAPGTPPPAPTAPGMPTAPGTPAAAPPPPAPGMPTAPPAPGTPAAPPASGAPAPPAPGAPAAPPSPGAPGAPAAPAPPPPGQGFGPPPVAPGPPPPGAAPTAPVPPGAPAPPPPAAPGAPPAPPAPGAAVPAAPAAGQPQPQPAPQSPSPGPSADGGKVSLDKGRVSLQKQQSVSLVKGGRPVLTAVKMGLGWEPAYGRRSGNIDLDASVVAFDANRKKIASCSFLKLSILGGTVRHSGDNLTGEGAGDDEVITIDLGALPAEVTGLVCTVNSFSGQKFTDVAKAYCRLLDAATDEELVRFDLTNSEPRTGVLMCKLVRQFSGEWEMTALGEYVDARTVRGMVKPAAAAL